MDKIETLNKRLKVVVEKYNALKKSGMDQEILEIYLAKKTGLSLKNVRDLLTHVDSFYLKLIRNVALDKLEEK